MIRFQYSFVNALPLDKSPIHDKLRIKTTLDDIYPEWWRDWPYETRQPTMTVLIPADYSER